MEPTSLEDAYPRTKNKFLQLTNPPWVPFMGAPFPSSQQLQFLISACLTGDSLVVLGRGRGVRHRGLQSCPVPPPPLGAASNLPCQDCSF